jgi:hypothetical protein
MVHYAELVTVKLSLGLTKDHAMKMYWEVAPCILNLGTKWPLYCPRNSPRYPLDGSPAGLRAILDMVV